MKRLLCKVVTWNYCYFLFNFFFLKSKRKLLIVQFQASTRSANWNKNRLQDYEVYTARPPTEINWYIISPIPYQSHLSPTPLHLNTCLNISPPNIQWQQRYIWNNPKQHMHPSQFTSDTFPNELNPDMFTSAPHTRPWFLSQSMRLLLLFIPWFPSISAVHLAHIFIRIFRKCKKALSTNVDILLPNSIYWTITFFCTLTICSNAAVGKTQLTK